MTQTQKVTPVLLGSDMNVYGMARSFYELTGQPVDAYARIQLAPTRFSKIVTVHTVADFDSDPTFINTMLKLKEKYRRVDGKVLLIACGDTYAELISKHKAELSDVFICPYVDYDLLKQLNDKENFYKMCDKYGLLYPKTKIITKQMYENKAGLTVPFDFPVALKPADSVEWLNINFEGRKKAFIVHSQAEFLNIVSKIYDNGYTSDLILQDFIPGDDSNMRVLNAYVDHNHHVKMMCLGHPLLEDPTPGSIGNYVAIVPEYNQDIYDRMQKFLEEINFTGFANFDMKFDRRDNTFKLFEINIRQGRSSFFVTLNGYNLAKWLIEDYVTGDLDAQPTVYGNKDVTKHQLWLGVPKKVFEKYAAPSDAKNEAMHLLSIGHYGTTVFYNKDMSFKRRLLLTYMFYKYNGRFKRYFNENKNN